MRGEKIPIDILTSDPNHYVRCALMIQTLDLLPLEVLDLVERREWTLRTREGMRAFEVFEGKTIPTLCVDGHKCFENLIPTIDELYLAVATAARTDEQKDVILKAWSLYNAEEAPVSSQLSPPGLKTRGSRRMHHFSKGVDHHDTHSVRHSPSNQAANTYPRAHTG